MQQWKIKNKIFILLVPTFLCKENNILKHIRTASQLVVKDKEYGESMLC